MDKEKFVLNLGHLLEKIKIPLSIKNEIELEYALSSHIKKFVQKNLSQSNNLDGILFHHGRNKREKAWWTKSKLLQTVKLFGDNVSDIFITHRKIGAVALEFKYIKLASAGKGLTGHIQRAIGQSLIAKLRHPFVICAVFYNKKQRNLKPGLFIKLKKLLWNKHRIYLIIKGV